MTQLLSDGDLELPVCDFASERCRRPAVYTVLMHVMLTGTATGVFGEERCRNAGFALCAKHTAEVLQRYAAFLPTRCTGCGVHYGTLHEATEVAHINMGATL